MSSSWFDTIKNGLGYLFGWNIEPLFTAEVRRNIRLYMNHEEIVTHLRQEELLTDKEVRRAFLNHSIGQ